MRRWIIAALVRIYPCAWRARYGEEYRALLEQSSVTVRDILDSARGAWDAHVRGYQEGTSVPPLTRPATLIVFGAWLVYVVAGMELYATVDDTPFVPAMRAHPAFSLAWQALAAGAALSLAAVVAGGIPIAIGVLQYAIIRRRGLLWLLLAVVAAITCVTYVLWLTALSFGWIVPPGFLGPITTVTSSPQPTPVQVAPTIGILTALLSTGAVLASGVALIVLAARSEIGTMRLRLGTATMTLHPYRLARLFASLVAVAMLVSVAATALWGLCARVYTPETFAANARVWQAVTLMMAAATLIAARITWHAGTKHLPARPAS